MTGVDAANRPRLFFCFFCFFRGVVEGSERMENGVVGMIFRAKLQTAWCGGVCGQ